MAYNDNYLDRDVMLQEMARRVAQQRSNGGIAGNRAEVAEARGQSVPGLDESAQTAEQAAQQRNYQTLGEFANTLGGYNMDKFNRPYDEWSEKYKIGAVQSHFDPKKGVTPEFLAALNGLDIGDFSGSEDWLSVANPRNGFRSEKGGGADIVQKFKSGNGNWTYWSDPALDPATAKTPMGQSGLEAPSSTLRAFAPSDMGTYNALQEKLLQILGGDAAMDRDELLRRLGAPK